MINGNYNLLVITGPTAMGKTRVAALTASRINGEVISADSRQVYRRMNLGTGKDYDDYLVNGVSVPYHLVDIAEPGSKYNLFEFQRDFIRVYNEIVSGSSFPVVCGGSGMYIDSIVSGYRLAEVPPDINLRRELEKKSLEELTEILKSYKKLHNKTDIDTVKRAVRAIEIEKYYQENREMIRDFPALKCLVVGINAGREVRRSRISQRLRQRIENGLIDEVRSLLDEGIDSETLVYYGLEYKYVTLYLTGRLEYEEMYRKLETEIHRFAKRQMTWFRGMERRGIKIHWLDVNDPDDTKVDYILNLLLK
ncbi:MAG TPA: tRNA (adenosine(37)-N6)-dimethylallyltransferase MiaA [Bacteroidales bacterium]|nr:tRNA (adenosine(37)-N6)-dimethylallyltransferase MiaA [Bacteroidales bacterium]HRR93901.1 tRNA (adenosine(37)-N6)-dimethylallyltransferase MiaA [Bacteroidales bacterium]HRT90428.1 tRNA (adenosine(37)-N6)-dimethylallyltransferase MiaA [Bacteroidales bacterium]